MVTIKSSFASNALKRYYKEKIYQTLRSIDVDDEENNSFKQTLRYTKFRTYKVRSVIVNLISAGSPISVIILKNKDISVSFMDGANHMVTKLIPDDENGTMWFGSWVTTLTIGDTLNETKNNLMDDSKVIGYGLALPVSSEKLRKEMQQNKNSTIDNDNHVYQIVTYSWTERVFSNSGIQYNLPKVIGGAYS